MNDKSLIHSPRSVNKPFLVSGIFLLLIYFLFSRIIDPFNFLEAYKDFTPVTVVKLKWYMWLLPSSFFLISFSLSDLLGANFLKKIDGFISKINRGRFLTGIFILSMIEIILISYFVLRGLPHFLDEFVYYFQAKVLAGGHLYAPSPPKGFFDYLFFYNDEGKWFTRHFPGFPLILSIGMLLNFPRFINPILSTLTLIIFYYLVLSVSENEKIARYSLILLILSPFYPFMAASYMSHPASMFLCTSFIFLFIKTLKSNSVIHPLLLGFTLGLEYVTRPVTFTAMALPYAVYFTIIFISGKVNLKKVIFIIVPFILWVGFFLYYNYTLTGNMLKTPMQLGGSVHLGFGPNEGVPNEIGANTGFTTRQGLWQMKSKLVMLGVDLFGWGGFSLIFLPFAFFDRKNKKWDLIFFLNFILITLTYFIAHNRGMMYGPRYFFCILPFFAYFTVKGIIIVIDYLDLTLQQREYSLKKSYFARNIVITFVILFFIRSFFEYVPAKAKFYSSLLPSRTLYEII
ncbi:hypothetical protein KKB18_00865, partial [bacterium]|nr:hypothetical protein [bacterium]